MRVCNRCKDLTWKGRDTSDGGRDLSEVARALPGFRVGARQQNEECVLCSTGFQFTLTLWSSVVNDWRFYRLRRLDKWLKALSLRNPQKGFRRVGFAHSFAVDVAALACAYGCWSCEVLDMVDWCYSCEWISCR